MSSRDWKRGVETLSEQERERMMQSGCKISTVCHQIQQFDIKTLGGTFNGKSVGMD